MLEVQKYLKEKTLEDLKSELGIKVTEHDSLPLIILNYDQIESPKTHKIVRECRALVLHKETFEVVARSFPRFFNWGEVQEEMKLFDFSSVSIQSKEDGSLALLYYFDGHWRVNTRGSFAQDVMQNQNHTWEAAICKALKNDNLDTACQNLDTNVTYVCEFCSPWNKIVRRYEQPCLYLLSAFVTKTGKELSKQECNLTAFASNMLRPEVYNFCTIEDIQLYLQEKAEKDPTYEGVVIRDANGLRYKIKSATYLGLHKLRGEGDNIFNPKYLLPFVLSGEEDELLTYFPEVKEQFYVLKAFVWQAYAKLLEVWAENKDIEEQKEFALKVKDTPFSGILFNVRKKYGKNQTVQDIKKEWRESSDSILKKLN